MRDQWRDAVLPISSPGGFRPARNSFAGKMHYRQGLAVPITVRLPSGGGFSGGPFQLSQNPEAWFMHSPGIKVGCAVDG